MTANTFQYLSASGRWVVFWLVCTLSAAASAGFREVPAEPQHIALLQQGGLVVYMRHGNTNAHIPDQIPVNLDDCNSQRPLTAAGRQRLDEIGGYVAQLQIPYQQVISSPFCRARESAQRVFGKPPVVDIDLRYTAAMPASERQPAVARTLFQLSQPVSEPGQNRIVVAHGPNIAELMDYLPKEGTLILFRPLGNGQFEYLASIPPAHWPVLLQQLQAAALLR